MGKIYRGKRLRIKSRKELLAGIRPQLWRHLRADTGDMPENSDRKAEIRDVPHVNLFRGCGGK